MKIALFSDIHANLPALEAVFEDMDERDADMVFCLGDLVGYAPWPNEVVETIRSRRIPTIAGNYDEGVGLNSDDCGCAYKTEEDERRGAESIRITNGLIREENRAYLRALPRHMRVDLARPRDRDAAPLRLLMVHGSPRRVNEYLFEDRPDASFVRMLETAGADALFFGHTHKPYHKRLSGSSGQTLHAVNIGSVGKPKDGDPRACYVMLELGADDPSNSEALGVDFIRVPYDVERAAAAVEQSELPDAFAQMLRNGG